MNIRKFVIFNTDSLGQNKRYMKKYEEIWDKIEYLMKLKNNYSDGYIAT